MRLLSYPIGDVVNFGVYKKGRHYVYKPTPGYDHLAKSALWWCPVEYLDRVRDACKEWKGFTLHVGEAGGGSLLYPEVIVDSVQERKAGGAYTTSSRGAEALIGDTLVWLEIDDVEKAEMILDVRTDIPVAVRCDAIRYMTDADYRRVFNYANTCFIHYYATGNPVSAKSKVVDEDADLRDLYGVE